LLIQEGCSRVKALEVQSGVKADAVALWRAAGSKRSVKAVAADLNVNTETLRSWIHAAERSGANGAAGSVPAAPEAEVARLQAENARLVKAEKEWLLEREILRRAAAYFAKEMK
jgi:transposase